MVITIPNNSLGNCLTKGEERMATIVTSYNQKVKEELERDIDMRNWQNENQPVYIHAR
jgi:hypothetical protein